MKTKSFRRPESPFGSSLLLNILTPIIIVLGFGFFYLSFAVVLLFVVPALILYVFIRYQIFKHRFKKILVKASKGDF